MKQFYFLTIFIFATLLSANSQTIYSKDFETDFTNDDSVNLYGYSIWTAAATDIKIVNSTGEGANSSDWYIIFDYVGYAAFMRTIEVEAGYTYTFSLNYKKVAGSDTGGGSSGSAKMGVFSVSPAAPIIESAALNNVEWTSVSVQFDVTSTQDYHFRFYRAWTSNSPVFQVDDFVVTREVTLGNKNTTAVDFSIYPNPVNATLNIQTQEALQAVQIIDVLGNLIYTTKENVKTVDTSNLANGVYVVKVTTATGKVASNTFVKH